MKTAFAGAVVGVLAMGTSVAAAAGATITITHDLDTARRAEVVSIPFTEIAAVLPEARMYHLVVRDPKGKVIPSQITNYEHDHRGVKYDDLVFSYDFKAGEKRATFTLDNLAAATPPDPPCVYARFIPERFDDMAWENDRIAHRTYGATLNTPAATFERLRGSGVDVWGKRVTYPIVDRWYQKGHDQFHKDGEGEGLDLYSIGGARGDGGTGIWDGAKLWTSDNFAKATVMSNGPRRAAFTLDYAAFEIAGGASTSSVKRFTVDCGVNFDQVSETFSFAGDKPLTAAVGLTEHKKGANDPDPILTRDPDNRWLSLWEENGDGGLGTAIILGKDVTPTGYAKGEPDSSGKLDHLLMVKVYDKGPLNYSLGAGWNRSGQFTDRASWEAYVKDAAARIQHPLTIRVTK
ncbi:MAG TPA: DUF4861 family protein [Steroidobacteraceae bacterium]|nr:DUF4861 family protein [Steroidobacteraceae bacterium]